MIPKAPPQNGLRMIIVRHFTPEDVFDDAGQKLKTRAVTPIDYIRSEAEETEVIRQIEGSGLVPRAMLVPDMLRSFGSGAHLAHLVKPLDYTPDRWPLVYSKLLDDIRVEGTEFEHMPDSEVKVRRRSSNALDTVVAENVQRFMASETQGMPRFLNQNRGQVVLVVLHDTSYYHLVDELQRGEHRAATIYELRELYTEYELKHGEGIVIDCESNERGLIVETAHERLIDLALRAEQEQLDTPDIVERPGKET